MVSDRCIDFRTHIHSIQCFNREICNNGISIMMTHVTILNEQNSTLCFLQAPTRLPSLRSSHTVLLPRGSASKKPSNNQWGRWEFCVLHPKSTHMKQKKPWWRVLAAAVELSSLSIFPLCTHHFFTKGGVYCVYVELIVCKLPINCKAEFNTTCKQTPGQRGPCSL